MTSPDDACSHLWRYADLIRCGETWAWATSSPDNGGRGHDPACFGLPREAASWASLAALAAHVLDPLSERWGRPTLTYGFAGPDLVRLVAGRVGKIAPALDQHAACELRPDGRPICPRLGAAVDLLVPGTSSFELARWIVDALDFDRLYLYGSDRPLHVSHGPEHTRSIIFVERREGRATPRRLTPATLRPLR